MAKIKGQGIKIKHKTTGGRRGGATPGFGTAPPMRSSHTVTTRVKAKRKGPLHTVKRGGSASTFHQDPSGHAMRMHSTDTHYVNASKAGLAITGTAVAGYGAYKGMKYLKARKTQATRPVKFKGRVGRK